MRSELINGLVTTILDSDNCPACAGHLDAATGTDGKSVPVPGDISICIHCGSLLEYKDNLKLSLLSDQVKAEVSAEDMNRLLAIQHQIRANKTFH